MIRLGPVGEKVAGCSEVIWDEKGRTVISNIYVSFNKDRTTSIRFGYLEDGALVLSKQFGPSEGHNFRVVMLMRDEYVTGMSGVLTACRTGIKNLTFYTDSGMHGPIGSLDDDNVGSTIELHPAIHSQCEFNGFFGSYNGSSLSSIGFYVNPIARAHTVVKREDV